MFWACGSEHDFILGETYHEHQIPDPVASVRAAHRGGCSKVKEMYEDRKYETKVTNFDDSIDFSSFHTFAHSGMTDRGRKIAATDNTSPLRMRIKEIVN